MTYSSIRKSWFKWGGVCCVYTFDPNAGVYSIMTQPRGMKHFNHFCLQDQFKVPLDIPLVVHWEYLGLQGGWASTVLQMLHRLLQSQLGWLFYFHSICINCARHGGECGSWEQMQMYRERICLYVRINLFLLKLHFTSCAGNGPFTAYWLTLVSVRQARSASESILSITWN